MKKFLFMLLSFVCGCTNLENKSTNGSVEVSFKNPIFYERMVPDKEGPDLILTPTTIIVDMHKFGLGKGTCELLENEESYIVTLCTVYYPDLEKPDIYKHKYTIDENECWKLGNAPSDAEEGDGRECAVREYMYDIDNDRVEGMTIYTVKQIKH